MIRPWMGISLVALPLLTAPARANSITTYGVIITALGNDMQVQTVDQAQAAAVTSGGPADLGAAGPTSDVGSNPSGVMITPNGSGGLLVTPWTNSPVSSPTASPPDASGSMSSGGSGGGVNDVLPVPVPAVEPVTSGSTASVPPIVAPPAATGTASGGDGSQPINGAGPPIAANSPEPASLTLLAIAGLGGLGFARRRRS